MSRPAASIAKQASGKDRNSSRGAGATGTKGVIAPSSARGKADPGLRRTGRELAAGNGRTGVRPAGRSAPRATAASAAKTAPLAGAGRATSARRAQGSAPAGVAAAAASALALGPTASLGSALGLHRVDDPLDLRSGVALVIDRDSGEILFEKNPQYVLPIASLTKVMAAMVVIDAGQSLDEEIIVTSEDRDLDRFSSSHLPVGSRLSRLELLQLSLMSSENRAAAALARSYPGGIEAFVQAANAKARAIGMVDSTFADGTGLSAGNVATAHDLARMVAAAGAYTLIRELSLATSLSVRLPGGARSFHTTNRLVGSPNWDLELQKTGYISEAGNCLLLQARVDDRSLIVVLLDSFGRYSRIGDAERIRRWLQNPV